MSIEHLKQLKNKLTHHNWNIISETGGNDYDVSALWVVARPDGSNQFHIEFLGLDDLETLPIEKSYACRIKERPEVSAYFSKISKSWPEELSRFITTINIIFKSLDEVGKDFKITRERIKQIEAKALRKLERSGDKPPDDVA